MRFQSHIIGLLTTSLLSFTNATPPAKPSTPSLPLAAAELQYFGDKTWAENIAIRSNGQILITRLDTPILQLLDPTNKTAPITLHTFNTTTYIGRKHNQFLNLSPDVQLYRSLISPNHSRCPACSAGSSLTPKLFFERQLLTHQFNSSRYYPDNPLLKHLLCRPSDSLHICLYQNHQLF